MNLRTEEQFKSELEAAQERLRRLGKEVEVSDLSTDESGLNCDFELPYSSLPAIRSQRWTR